MSITHAHFLLALREDSIFLQRSYRDCGFTTFMKNFFEIDTTIFQKLLVAA